MTRIPPFLLLLIAAGCSDRAPTRATPQQGGDVAAQVKGDMEDVRLTMAEKRIVELEKQVGALEATPEKIDLDLLTKRLEQVEARVYARSDLPPPAAPPTPREPVPQPTPSPIPNRFNPFGL